MRTFIIFIGILVSGCSTTWTHNSADQAQFFRDKAECENYANSIQRTVVTNRQSAEKYNTTCETFGNNTNCSTVRDRSGDVYERISQQAEQSGANFGHDLAVGLRFENCMKAKQYRKQ